MDILTALTLWGMTETSPRKYASLKSNIQKLAYNFRNFRDSLSPTYGVQVNSLLEDTTTRRVGMSIKSQFTYHILLDLVF